MADKDSILIIEVDLACHTCYTRIQKVLCKIQVKENIKSISYDTKKNEVTISGSFNPHQLYHKLTCKTGCVIKGHKIPVKETEEEKKKKEEEKKKKEAEEKKKKEEEEKKKKEAEEKKKKEEEKKEVATASANSTVNLQFTKVCIICYPWPCSDPTGHCQQRQRDVAMVPAGNHHQRNTCTGPPRCGGCGSCGGGGGGGCWQPNPLPPICCPGPPRCGGCGSCGGGGGWWQPKPLPPIGCPGPSCRGCNGCRVVHEQKYEYHEYPPSACIVM